MLHDVLIGEDDAVSGLRLLISGPGGFQSVGWGWHLALAVVICEGNDILERNAQVCHN